MKLSKVGVIGAGTIGTGVVTDLVLHGIDTVVVDKSEGALAKAEVEVLKNIRFAPTVSKNMPRVKREDALNRMRLSQKLEDLVQCEFIIENVPERWEIKQPIYEQLDALMPRQACFGANTSCISITRIASLTQRPENIIGIHFINPVHLVPGVEAIRGFHTSEQTLQKLLTLLGQLKKEVVVVEDLPGFVSNRISHVFMNEAAFVLQDNLATAEKVDQIFKTCFGHKLGPLEMADMIGLDTVVNSLTVLYESFQDPKYRCCPLLRKLVDAGYLGCKSGRGFYTYPPKERS
jgi:3-hydroxybutyryl-CoA dehydrogenase